jgi:S-adenosyl methyltransferase
MPVDLGVDGSAGALPFLNPTVPNVARIYDYLLGGKDNFAADREAMNLDEETRAKLRFIRNTFLLHLLSAVIAVVAILLIVHIS